MARPKADDPKRRRRILAVSEKLFAKKGFDATCVADIAAAAGVNKALIYYYFKNKDAILEEVIVGFVATCVTRAAEAVASADDALSERAVRELMSSNLRFLEQNRNILRIIIMESLKTTRRVPHLIRAIDPKSGSFGGRSAAEMMLDMRQKGIRIGPSLSKALVNEFFTQSIPTMAFVLFHRAWAEHFGVREADLRRWFVEAIESTHFAYHRSAPTSKKKETEHVREP
jgi:AcrR family transcriptional regulator